MEMHIKICKSETYLELFNSGNQIYLNINA